MTRITIEQPRNTIRGFIRRLADAALVVTFCGLWTACGISSNGATTTNFEPLSVEGNATGQGRTIRVPAQGDFQAALNQSQPGDTIILLAGATYTGAFILPKKPGASFVTITSSRASELAENRRVTPGDAARMAKLIGGRGNAPVISTQPQAHHYRFIGIEFALASEVTRLVNLIELGSDSQTTRAQQPHHLEFDRILVRIPEDKQTRRAFAANGAHITLTNSHLAGLKEEGADSQAFMAWNASGPFVLINNYLEGAGENVMFGGSDSSAPELVPSDIEIRRNHFFKPLSWQGSRWSIKNLFELKSAQRVTVDGNLFENVWDAAQNGTALQFTPRNQDGRAVWSVVRDVTFTNNIVRGAVHGLNLLGEDYSHPSGATVNIRFHNNLFQVERVAVRLNGNRLDNIAFTHNTFIAGYKGFVAESEARVTNLSISDNITKGSVGHEEVEGTTALARFAGSSWRVSGNMLVGGNAQLNPQGNSFPSSFSDLGFMDVEKGDIRLRSDSVLKRRGSKSVGVNYEALSAALGANNIAALESDAK